MGSGAGEGKGEGPKLRPRTQSRLVIFPLNQTGYSRSSAQTCLEPLYSRPPPSASRPPPPHSTSSHSPGPDWNRAIGWLRRGSQVARRGLPARRGLERVGWDSVPRQRISGGGVGLGVAGCFPPTTPNTVTARPRRGSGVNDSKEGRRRGEWNVCWDRWLYGTGWREARGGREGGRSGGADWDGV